MGTTKRNKIKSIIAIILPAIVVFGNYSFGEVRVFGLVLTVGRVFIPLICLYLLLDAFKNKGMIALIPGLKERGLLAVLAIWVVYAAVTIVLMPYADFHDGMLEILALILGAMIVINVVILCGDGNWDYIMAGLKVALFLTLVIGAYEIITGNHLSTSRFCDPEFIAKKAELLGDEYEDIKFYVATSIFYNENDYSAMLAVFAPMIVCRGRYGKGWIWGFDLLIVCLCYMILYFNNAFICFIALILGLIIAVLYGFNNTRDRLIVIASIVVSRIGVFFLEKKLLLRLGWGDTIRAQLENGSGSMMHRINTYKITITETFLTSKGMGFGAGSFTKYFSQFVESHDIMANPHCFWFEILSEYGVFVFFAFVGVLIFIMASLIGKYRKTKNPRYIAVIASGASLVIASVAPSKYLMYAYYWMPIALAVYLVDFCELGIDQNEDYQR